MKTKILVVEDHVESAVAICRLLAGTGHAVTVAHDCAHALSAGPFELLLTDIGLPDCSGIDLLRQLHKRGTFKSIAMTGYEMSAEECLAAGFDDHITKPLDFSRLEELIQRVMTKNKITPHETFEAVLVPQPDNACSPSA